MALLTLKDIGKIYVSDGNVAVGIRGVNLSFDRGEFVAVTGKSGSGKSTLLNVISGMDSYEEGDLIIEGQTTSHYLQPDWEDYRQKYISFIFQDYNIIESFTVLQNVELALMHMADRKARRERALELLDRVGMSSHIRQKGSKLSGGQKQRTVIARALAKDSPIILADEPTGNLDSATSEEIIKLLHEVSADKLLVVVTHNFEQVAEYATRHIRIFDGAVESDHAAAGAGKVVVKPPRRREDREEPSVIKNGITLGHTIFTAKPKLSFFFCMLLLIGTLGIFLVTSLCGSAVEMFEKPYMFNNIDGRVVLIKRTGEPISDAELDKLVADYGAEGCLHYDMLLDKGESLYVMPDQASTGLSAYYSFQCTYGEDFGSNNIIGRYPEADNEVFLYLPLYYQDDFGKNSIKTDRLKVQNTEYKVTGLKYFVDNNKPAKMLFTQNGFRTATSIYYLSASESRRSIEIKLNGKKGETITWNLSDFVPSFDIEPGKAYIDISDYQKYIIDYQKLIASDSCSTLIEFNATYNKFNHYFNGRPEQRIFTRTITDDDITTVRPETASNNKNEAVIISTELLNDIANGTLEKSYRQASLFFADNKAAAAAAEKLNDVGYLAVSADTTYTRDPLETIANTFSCIALAAMWGLAVVFLAFFINLCSSRTLGAFKSDMAIMRSMGIPVKAIRVGMYVRMLISLIPAYIIVTVSAFVIFLTPTLNGFFTYLYAWQYALIFIGMLLLTLRVTYKQIRKLFGESVKKSLKGGAAE